MGHSWPCQSVATLLNMEVLCVLVCERDGGCIELIYCFFVFSQIRSKIMQNEVREKDSHISVVII